MAVPATTARLKPETHDKVEGTPRLKLSLIIGR